MRTISKNTMFSASLATMISIVAGVWYGVSEVQAWVGQIATNTESISLIMKSLELRDIDGRMALAKSEERELNRELRKDPENDLIIEQLDEIEDNLEHLVLIRSCIVSDKTEVCE